MAKKKAPPAAVPVSRPWQERIQPVADACAAVGAALDVFKASLPAEGASSDDHKAIHEVRRLLDALPRTL